MERLVAYTTNILKKIILLGKNDWQMYEVIRVSAHLMNPITKYEVQGSLKVSVWLYVNN